MPRTTAKESSIQRRITEWLKKERIYYVKVHGGPYGRAGVPDLLICYRGLFVAVEVKKPDTRNNTTDHQKRELEAIKQSDGIAGVCTSLEEVKELLERIDND